VNWRRHCATAEDTQVAGQEFARVLRPGDVVLLSGQLGNGKTTFAQGVARGLGVRERVTSPTFTMVRQHECVNDLGISTFHHADVFRVESLVEVRDLALGELVEESAVALVEWGEIASSVFGRDVMNVDFVLDANEGRTLVVSGVLSHDRAALLDQWASQ
jgi:tRNA threonylcarbamoyladenosine biosynthesis protein TsaE